MKFDELLAQQLSMRKHYRESKARKPGARAAGRKGAPSHLGAYRAAAVPADLCAAADLGEIERDLAQPHPMHRLLQGDVGSGKTVIAVLAACARWKNGLQAAVMAPTETWRSSTCASSASG